MFHTNPILPLAGYVQPHDPFHTEGCALCAEVAALRTEDAAFTAQCHQDQADHVAFMRQLKAWARRHPEPFRSQLRSRLNKLERECPTTLPRRLL